MVKRIERVLRATDRFQQRHGVLGFPVAVIKKFGDDQAGKHAALLAYYGFLSLFPLLLVFVTVLGYAIANNPGLRQQLIDTVTTRFPGFGPQLQASITTIGGSGIGLVTGVLGTLWGGLGITQSAQDAMNAVWNIPRKDRPNPWRGLLPGAAAGAVGWSVLQALGAWIVTRQLARANLVYGAFAIVIVLLGWLYLSAQLLLYAAEVNVV